MIRNMPAQGDAATRSLASPADPAAAIQEIVQRFVGQSGLATIRDIGNGSCFGLCQGVPMPAAPALEETYFVRASIDPEADLKRGFSVVANAVVDHEHEIAEAIAETYPDGAEHLRPPRLDPATNMWCWEVEAGLSSFAVPGEAAFPRVMERVHSYASHLGCVAVFASSDFDLGGGTDGEDVFRDGRFVGWLDLEASYADFLKLTDPPPSPAP